VKGRTNSSNRVSRRSVNSGGDLGLGQHPLHLQLVTAFHDILLACPHP
jgi:hypothetical protein